MHIAFVEQNSSILELYPYLSVLNWANKIIKANKQESIQHDQYFKEQLYLRLIRIIKMKKK